MNSDVSDGVVKGEGSGRWEGKSEKWLNAMSTVAPSFIWVAGDRAMIRFPRKRWPSVSTVRVIRMRIRGVVEFGSSKDFEIRCVLEKEPRSNGHTSYQADRHDYLPKVKIEISEQMSDRTNNSSARSVVTEKLGPNQRLIGDLI
jgi:hypothetical protein